MQFRSGKPRRTPTVIIVSLIDVLLVVLIFLMVSTTAKKEPPPVLKLALPESKHARPGATDSPMLVVSVATNAPYLWLGDKPVTLERLQQEFIAAARKDPKVVVTIKADKRAPFGEVVRVIDAAKTAQVGGINAMTERTAQQPEGARPQAAQQGSRCRQPFTASRAPPQSAPHSARRL